MIRLRLEDHQFLLSCVELETFIRWLDHLNAAIAIAEPIDERSLPRDQTIPRVMRIRWLREQYPTIPNTDMLAGLASDPASDIGLPTPEATRNLGHTPRLHDHVDPETGKWAPRHCWTSVHGLLYAKLCYSILLFKSPRKSNYVVSGGKRWFVDWNTGRIVRVLPPPYHELELSGPWNVLDGYENRLL